jgi:hypothetical protein
MFNSSADAPAPCRRRGRIAVLTNDCVTGAKMRIFVEMSALVDNGCTAHLEKHPEISAVPLCRGHPRHVTDDTCRFAHLTPHQCSCCAAAKLPSREMRLGAYPAGTALDCSRGHRICPSCVRGKLLPAALSGWGGSATTDRRTTAPTGIMRSRSSVATGAADHRSASVGRRRRRIFLKNRPSKQHFPSEKMKFLVRRCRKKAARAPLYPGNLFFRPNL